MAEFTLPIIGIGADAVSYTHLIEKQHAQGKMTARERIGMLLDVYKRQTKRL